MTSTCTDGQTFLWNLQRAWHCALFASQPDLLNFKKGWMSKLDDSGEVRYSNAECRTSLRSPIFLSPLPSFLMRKVVCKAIVADYHSNSLAAWASTGVPSLWMICSSKWASRFTSHTVRLLLDVVSVWCVRPGKPGAKFDVTVSDIVIVLFWLVSYLNLRSADLSSVLD